MDAWTLKDYVLSLFKQNKTDTSEFKTLIKIYGREKFESWWREYLSELRQKHQESKQRAGDKS